MTTTCVNNLTQIGELSDVTFDRLRKIIYSRSGISLNDGKAALIKARVSKRLRLLNLTSFEDYLDFLAKDSSGDEMNQLLDAVSTNVTHFFREAHHFEFLNRLATLWKENGKGRLRIWSSGCSSGEEPYSIAMELAEATGSMHINAKILATDIASSVLNICQKGEYKADRIESLAPVLRARYFTVSKVDGEHVYTVRPELRELVITRQFNLVHFPYPIRHQLDVIFCRNVMIYFDRETKAKIVNEFHRVLKPGGHLFVGHAESLPEANKAFVSAGPTIYRKV
ncbi:MAG: protein-glutamate O-methyltransferase CheR [Candidatus Zixiibacteriota bacterium]